MFSRRVVFTVSTRGSSMIDGHGPIVWRQVEKDLRPAPLPVLGGMDALAVREQQRRVKRAEVGAIRLGRVEELGQVRRWFGIPANSFCLRKCWPRPNLRPGGELGDPPPVGPEASVSYRHDPTVGLDSIGFDPWTTAVLDPGGHNGDDAHSLCFTSEPSSTASLRTLADAGPQLPTGRALP
jgi:hypothetical protein